MVGNDGRGISPGLTMPVVVLLNPGDNVVVCCRLVRSGERIIADGVDIVSSSDVELGHKLARHALEPGDPVVKYGVRIGSMTARAAAGDWIHVHNMKSDYISPHSREGKGHAA